MKITAFILFAFCLQVSAATLAQTVTLSARKTPLEKVINDIKQQTGYSFFYNEDWMQQSKPVNLEVKNLLLEQALKAAFKDQPFDYAIVNKTIVLKLKEKPAVPNVPATPGIISGSVVDGTGQPMVGVTIREKGTQNGTLTDEKGKFQLAISDETATISFSYIGYQTKEMSAKDIFRGAAITLSPAENNLKEVVVDKGYYSQKQIENTGDVSTVRGADIQKQPVTDPILALDGRVPGLYIQQSIGVPGSNSVVRIRGQNSIFNGNDPLYIVDGVPYNSTSPSSPSLPGDMLGIPSADGRGMSPFNELDPSDIESIAVLKDADATAIYGSRGANGVILITTKKGKAGKTQVSVNAFSGVENVSHFLDLMNTQQYLQMRHESLNNDGLTPNPAQDFDLTAWDTTRYTNWQKVLIGNTAKFNNANVSLSGGNENTQFLINTGYSNQGTVYPGNFADQKASVSTSLTHTSSDKRFHLQMSINYVYDFSNLPLFDFTSAATLSPDAPALYDPNGNLNWAPVNGAASWGNPLASEFQISQNRIDNLVSNLNLSYQILPDLQLKVNAGFTHLQNNEQHESLSSASAPPGNALPDSRYYYSGTNDLKTWILEPQLAYEKTIAKGKLNVLIGSSFQQNLSTSSGLEANGFASDALITDIAAASSFQLYGENNTLYRYDAVFGRVGYTWDEKYIINFTARRDGSSRFGPGKQFGNFYAVGTGWVFSNETFVKNNLPFISFGKLRASYGITGNDQIGDYKYLSTYSPTGNTYQNLSSFTPTALTNPNFSWETVQKLEGGIELSFLKDRINVEVSYYRDRTQNSLVGYQLPYIAGFYTVEANFPATVQNSGTEFALNTINIKSTDFSWRSSLNFAIPENKLLAFPNLSSTAYANSLVIGQSLSVQKLFHYVGIDPKNGQAEFSTAGGGVTDNPSNPQDLEVTKPITQHWYGGIENTFSYKRFSLSFLFQYVNQTGFNYLHYQQGYQAGWFNTNLPTAVLNHWQKPGDITPYGPYSTIFYALADPHGDLYKSDWGLGNTSFLRLKNLAFSYNLPKTKAFQNCRIYLQCENLFTIAPRNFIGYDPETPANVLPPLRVITTGIQVTF